MPTLPEFTMRFEPTTIEHLGLKLYGSLPPVIGEMVSNSWDADATRVEIFLPEGAINPDSVVTIRDYGNGMTPNQLQDFYLPIGRNCRVELKTETTPGNRPIMGRKGLGKLAAFGIANDLEIRTIREGFAVCLKLSYDQMKLSSPPYKPTLVPDRTGPTDDPSGTEIRISRLHRSKKIESGWIKKELARRFTVIGENFEVFVNGEPINPADRRLREECRASWDVSELPDGDIVDGARGWKVSGWVGLVAKASQVDRGVDIFAKGKAVELDTMFGTKSTNTQFALAYIVGEIHADFLDGDEDNVSTGRNMAHWESEAGAKLQEWGAKNIRVVQKRWLELQRKEKDDRIRKTPGFEEWLQTRNPRERKVALKLVNAIVEDDRIDAEEAAPFLEIVKSNIEFQAFQELVEEINETGVGIDVLLRLVGEWRVFEAREHMRLADGRMGVIDQLDKFITKGALEVQEIQPLFEENGWLVNPTWNHVSGQNRYTELLRQEFVEDEKVPESDRRMDLLGYEVGGTLEIVELKRPKKNLTRDDLRQIEDYVLWARAKLIGTGRDAIRYVRGTLIVGELGNNAELQDLMERLAGFDIRVETFRDLHHRAKKVYGETKEWVAKIAPEYSKSLETKAA